MSEDASVNTDAANAPSFARAYVAVRRMQAKLHCWAVTDGDRRFDDLYNLVCDPAFLRLAWERVAGNKGARTPGVDRASVAMVTSGIGVEAFLHDVRDQLRSRTFRPVPVRQVMIPKASGKLRRLGIPTVTDRVVQGALKLVLEPIFEADFQSCSYGFRPNRRAADAIAEIHHFTTKRYEWVLEADIEACFDMIDHTALMDRRRCRISDKRVLALVKAFLKAGVMTTTGSIEGTVTGTPQGGILSPLLANIALSVLDDEFARRWNQQMATEAQRQRRRRKGQANYRLIRYADDFVIVVTGQREHAEHLLDDVATVIAPMGLRLSPEKTRVVQDGFGHAMAEVVRPPAQYPAQVFHEVSLLTDKQRGRLDDLFGVDEHVEVEATWDVYQAMIAAYREPDRTKGRHLMSRRIAAISHGVPAALSEVVTLGRTLTRRTGDILAYFDQPGTSNAPTEAINGRLEHLRGTALGFRNLTNYVARSLLETGGFRPQLHRRL